MVIDFPPPFPLFKVIRIVVGFEDFAMMGYPVKERRRYLVITEYLHALSKVEISDNDQ
jgi:hypothetical protein